MRQISKLLPIGLLFLFIGIHTSCSSSSDDDVSSQVKPLASIDNVSLNYRSSADIYNSILKYESENNLNGFLLLSHIGTDPKRTDKFYDRLDNLIKELKKRGYEFVRVDELLEE